MGFFLINHRCSNCYAGQKCKGKTMLSIILMPGLNVQCYNDIAMVADPPRGAQEPKQAVLSMEKQIADSD